MKQVMCAKDKLDAMTKIKAGTDNGEFVKESYAEECVQSIRKGQVAGRNVGLEGTPFMYLTKGDTRIIPGYQSSRIIISLFTK
jgi:thiol:disulfide interchange protein DsbC